MRQLIIIVFGIGFEVRLDIIAGCYQNKPGVGGRGKEGEGWCKGGHGGWGLAGEHQIQEYK